MAVLDPPIMRSCSRVEVSGWDEINKSFPEKAQGTGSDLTRRHIALQHKLRYRTPPSTR